tara:strand:- start:479 stop:880 length:402 start_codon:yes stop_codon:yes gene_type:complete
MANYKHGEANGYKARNGLELENYFAEQTGLEKSGKGDKPTFTNSHGIEQVVDFDFHAEVDGVMHYLDLTTTYRSDRAKQKAYNAFVYKKLFSENCKFYIVAGDVNDNKRRTVKLIEGLDGVISVEQAIEMVKK